MKRNLGTFLIVISVISLFCWLGWQWRKYSLMRRRQEMVLAEIVSVAKSKKASPKLSTANSRTNPTRILPHKIHSQWLDDTLRQNGEFRKSSRRK
jgi:hypothetical protein